MHTCQVDLSDDYILMMMFADGAWEAEMAPIEFEDEKSGSVTQLKMQVCLAWCIGSKRWVLSCENEKMCVGGSCSSAPQSTTADPSFGVPCCCCFRGYRRRSSASLWAC